MAEEKAVVPAQPQIPDTFRGRLAQFRILEESRHALIEELLDKLEKTEAKLQQTELDLTSEQNVRRRLQAEVVEAKEKEAGWVEKAARKPYAILLIDADADGFTFLDKFITKREKGGEAAADELLVKTREYLRPLYPDADKLDILVRIFANQEGMANGLVREGKIRNLGQLRAFSTGFNSRIASFDFVDVGVGKEGGAARKLRENLHHHASLLQTRHILLATSPTTIPPSLLTSLPLPLSSLTLLESAPLPPSLSTLPAIHTTSFPTIFIPLPPPIPKSGSGGRMGRPQLQLSQQEDREGGSTWLVIRPERSKSSVGRGGRGGSDEEDSSLSISIGPDNRVSFESGGRGGGGSGGGRRRIMER